MTRNLIAALVLAAGSLLAHDYDNYPSRYDDYDDQGYYAPAPPPVPAYGYSYRRPPMPGPGFVWVDPCWNFDRGRYVWAAGFWARPPFAGGIWVGPRYNSGRYYRGYWGGGHRGYGRGHGNWRHGYRR